MSGIQGEIKGFPAFYEASDDDSVEMGKIGQLKYEARKKTGDWPNPDDRSEMGLKRSGQAYRQVSEFAETTFYRRERMWLQTNGHVVHDVISVDQGHVVTIDFVTEEGRDAFLAVFPKWKLKRTETLWMDGLPITSNKYDLPDDELDAD